MDLALGLTLVLALGLTSGSVAWGPNANLNNYFTCSAFTTENSFDVVTVTDPIAVDVGAGCVLRQLVLTGDITGATISLVQANVNGSVSFMSPLVQTAIVIDTSTIGCNYPLPSAGVSWKPSTPVSRLAFVPTPNGAADHQGVYLASGMTDSSFVVRSSCITTSASGSSIPSTAFLQGGIVFGGSNLLRSNVTISDSAISATSLNLSTATAIHVQPSVQSTPIIITNTLLYAASMVTGTLAPAWSSSAFGINFVSFNVSASLTLVNSAVYALSTGTQTAQGIFMNVETGSIAQLAPVAAALVSFPVTVGTATSALRSIVSQFVTINSSRIDAQILGSSCGLAASGGCTATALRLTNALAMTVVVASSVINSAGVNSNASGLVVDNGMQLATLTVASCNVTVACSACAGYAVRIGPLDHAAFTASNTSVSVVDTTTAINATLGAVSVKGMKNSTFSLTAGSSVNLTCAVNRPPCVTLLVNGALSASALTLSSATVVQLGANTTNASAVTISGTVAQSFVSVISTTVQAQFSGFHWQSGGAGNTSAMLLDTVVITAPQPWRAIPSWVAPPFSQTLYFVSRCVSALTGGSNVTTVFTPPGTTSVVPCTSCVTFLACVDANTASAPYNATTQQCTCVCKAAAMKKAKLNSLCGPIRTWSRSRGFTKSPSSELTASLSNQTKRFTLTKKHRPVKKKSHTYTKYKSRTLSHKRVHHVKTHTRSLSGVRTSSRSPSRDTWSRSSSWDATGTFTPLWTNTVTLSHAPLPTRTANVTATGTASRPLVPPPVLTAIERAFNAIGIARDSADGIEAAVNVLGVLTGLANAPMANKGLNIARSATIFQCEYNPDDEYHYTPQLQRGEAVWPWPIGDSSTRYMKGAIVTTTGIVLFFHALLVTLTLRITYFIKTRMVVGTVTLALHLFFLPTAGYASMLTLCHNEGPSDVAVGAVGLVGSFVIGFYPIVVLMKMPSLYLAFRVFDRGARAYNESYVRFFIFEDLFVSWLVSIILGIQPPSHDACTTEGLVVCAVWLFHVGYLLVVRPQLRKILWVFNVFIAVFQLIMAAAAVATAVNRSALKTTAYIALIEMVFMLLQFPVWLYWRTVLAQRRNALDQFVDDDIDEHEKRGVWSAEEEKRLTVARYGPDPKELEVKTIAAREKLKQDELEKRLRQERQQELANMKGFYAVTFAPRKPPPRTEALVEAEDELLAFLRYDDVTHSPTSRPPPPPRATFAVNSSSSDDEPSSPERRQLFDYHAANPLARAALALAKEKMLTRGEPRPPPPPPPLPGRPSNGSASPKWPHSPPAPSSSRRPADPYSIEERAKTNERVQQQIERLKAQEAEKKAIEATLRKQAEANAKVDKKEAKKKAKEMAASSKEKGAANEAESKRRSFL